MHTPRRAFFDTDTISSIGFRLQAEWDTLARRRGAIDRARTWQVTDERFADLDELLVLAGHRRPTSSASEVILHRLLVRAGHDELAGRVVLQRMLPGLLAIVRRRSQGGSAAGLLEELVGAAWITIRTWDHRRQPPCLAPALLWSAEHHAFRSAARRMSATEVTRDLRRVERIAPPYSYAPTVELARLLRDARAAGVVEDDDVTFVCQLVRVQSPSELARVLGVTPRTVRNRRDRVTYRLRRVALAA